MRRQRRTLVTLPTPVSHWKLNDNLATTVVLDAIGANNLVSQHGNTSTLSTTTARQGRAFSFDGANDYLKKTIANYRSGDQVGSISFWVKTSIGANHQSIFDSSDEATATSYFKLLLRSIGGGIRMNTRNAGGTSNNIVGTINASDNEWHNGIITSDGSLWRIYVDSVLDEITILGGANTGDWFADITLRDNITIGASESTSVVTFQAGIVDDVRIYGVTLTQNEIDGLYNNGEGTER